MNVDVIEKAGGPKEHTQLGQAANVRDDNWIPEERK